MPCAYGNSGDEQSSPVYRVATKLVRSCSNPMEPLLASLQVLTFLCIKSKGCKWIALNCNLSYRSSNGLCVSGFLLKSLDVA